MRDISDTNEILRFGDAAIQRAVEHALAAAPEDHGNAVVAYVDSDGAHLAMLAKFNENWSLVGVLQKPWNKPVEGGAEIRVTWR